MKPRTEGPVGPSRDDREMDAIIGILAERKISRNIKRIEHACGLVSLTVTNHAAVVVPRQFSPPLPLPSPSEDFSS